jgi:hypothetical protein
MAATIWRPRATKTQFRSPTSCSTPGLIVQFLRSLVRDQTCRHPAPVCAENVRRVIGSPPRTYPGYRGTDRSWRMAYRQKSPVARKRRKQKGRGGFPISGSSRGSHHPRHGAVVHQHEIVADLKARGQDTTQAEEFLDQLERSQALHVARRDKLRRELGRTD